ncbi:MAG: adenylate/guanylate cyclase domain-containing protein [Leptospira sp.]|nr:adenylate/guanylate cyclase domain-containing protein [Leptospira sp.]
MYDLHKFDNLLETQINSTLQKGSAYSAFMGLSSALLLFYMQGSGLVKHMEAPILWTIIGGLFSLLISIMARYRLVKGTIIYFIAAGFVTLPTTIYILAYFFVPGGPATYVTGPASYLYFFTIAVCGLSFDARVATLAGLLAAIEYAIVCVLSFTTLEKISHPDPLFLQDLTSPPIYFFKSLMMLFTGLVVGVLATTAKKLMAQMLKEESEKSAISKLFGQFVSDEVKDKIIREKSEVIAENKEVAILFSDIRGFTSFSEKYKPDELVIHLNEYFDAMVESITRNGGIVDKFIGDAVMAYFGGLVEIESPSSSAFLAAQDMRKKLSDLNEKWKKIGLAPIDNGIGIHFGKVLQGTIGSRDRKDFTVIGDSVNTASRIESQCKEIKRPILLSEIVYANLPSELKSKCDRIGNVKLKGKEEEIVIFASG